MERVPAESVSEQPMMDVTEIRARVESFPRWHYEFNLRGVKTPIFDPAHVNRHKQRAAYFFEPMVKMYGGSLAGKRVLDLGCNAGFWSLKAIEAGADYVLGIEGRQMHVDQANLVFEVNQVDRRRYEFRTGNIFTDDFSDQGPFDVVLCLGLMYHVSKTVELIERMSAVNTDVLIIDTAISTDSDALMRLHQENLDEPRNAVDYETVFIPTRKAIIEIAQMFGYTVAPLALHAASYEGMRRYKWGSWLAFICAKTSDVSSLSQAPKDEPFARLERAATATFQAVRAGLSLIRLTARSRLENRTAD
jgi:2-polyprenyl-3-methyl-5-hydroxy-6-metoxy-1,4-benzoquinol methylase